MMLGLQKRTWAASLAVLAVLLFALTRSVRADQVFAIHATLQNAAVATGNGTALDVGGLSAVGVQVQGITTATVTWEGSIDGANWKGVIATNTRTQAQGTTATADDIYSVNTAGFQWLRARISAYTAGTITATALGATNGVAAGAAGGGASGAVTIASGGVASGAYSAGSIAAGAFVSGSVLSGAFAGGAIVDLGAIADAATSGTGTLNAHARQTALNTANIPALGQAVMAASTPVAIASNQSAIPVTESGTWTIQPGNTANTTPWLVAPTAQATGGGSMDSYICTGAANQDQHQIDASAGTLYSVAVFNVATTIRYLKFYNVASPTSASTPVLRLLVPPAPASGQAGGFTYNLGPAGAAFGTTITMRATAGQADNDATAVTSGDVVVNSIFK